MNRVEYLTILIVCNIAGCQTAIKEPLKIRVEQDSLVTSDKSAKVVAKKNEVVDLNMNPTLIESPGHVSTLIIPVEGVSSEISVRLRPVDGWGGEVYEQKSNAQMSDLMAGVIGIQHLMANGKSGQALEQFQVLEARYPKVTYLKFLKVTCLLINNKIDSARTSLTEALTEFPNDKVGLELQNALERAQKNGEFSAK